MKKKIIFILLLLVCKICIASNEDFLLVKALHGVKKEIVWGQKYNQEGGCSPSYNKFCPSNDVDSICNHDRAGCAAIAIGQIMAMWQYPAKSKYRTYNWNNIKAELFDGDTDDCPHLIRDLGEACNTHYHASGSWSAPHNLVDALEEFGYYADIEDYDYWGRYRSTNEWYDLIRSEIDCGRPVIMYGENSNVFHAHNFVIDGYDKENINKFHINLGKLGKGNGFYELKNVKYSEDQKIICGIYPKRSDMPKIKYKQMANFIIPNCIGYKLGGTYQVENADSWMCKVYDRNYKILWMTAGLVKNGYANVWDGSSTSKIGRDDYWYEITFKNSNGAREVVRNHVHYLPQGEVSVNKFNYDLINDNISPYCEGGEKYIELESSNAVLYAASVSDMYNNKVWSGSGFFEDGIAKIWNGEGANESGVYKINIELQGGCKTISKENTSYQVYYEGNDCGKTFINEVINDTEKRISIEFDKSYNKLNIKCEEIIKKVSVYNVSSSCVLVESVNAYSCEMNIDKIRKGIYFVVVETEGNTYTEKVLF